MSSETSSAVSTPRANNNNNNNNGAKDVACKSWVGVGCRRGVGCKCSHADPRGKLYAVKTAEEKAQEPCKAWVSEAGCHRGDSCPFDHSAVNGRAAEQLSPSARRRLRRNAKKQQQAGTDSSSASSASSKSDDDHDDKPQTKPERAKKTRGERRREAAAKKKAAAAAAAPAAPAARAAAVPGAPAATALPHDVVLRAVDLLLHINNGAKNNHRGGKVKGGAVETLATVIASSISKTANVAVSAGDVLAAWGADERSQRVLVALDLIASLNMTN
jgi:hypothetical protein